MKIKHANRLTHATTQLVDILNKHRGKGPQKMTVEHVHLHEGGQAIVGNVEQGRRGREKPVEQPHAKPVAHEPQPTVRSAVEADREPMPVARDEEREM